MKGYTLSFLMIVCGILFSQCAKKGEEGGWVEMTCKTCSESLSHESGKFQVQIRASSDDWSAETDVSWITLNKLSASVLEVTYEENTKNIAREASLCVTLKGSLSKEGVSQDAAPSSGS